MSTFKIASKFKTEAEKKAEQDALIDAAWREVPPAQGPLPRRVKNFFDELTEE